LTDDELAAAQAGTRTFGRAFLWSIRVAYSIADFAYTAYERGDHAFARAAFQALSLVNAQHAYPKSMIAVCEVGLGNVPAAIAAYTAALALDDRSTNAHTNRGELRLRRGEVFPALQDFTAAIALDPAGSDPFAIRARALTWAIGDAIPEQAANAAI